MTKTDDLFSELAVLFNPAKNAFINMLEVLELHKRTFLKTMELSESELFIIDTLDLKHSILGALQIDLEIRVTASAPSLLCYQSYEAPAEYSDWDRVQCHIEELLIWGPDGTEVKCQILNEPEFERELAKLL